MDKHVSPAGLALIRLREGCVLVAYQDSKGVWTIGVGHTGRMSPGAVTPGMRITVAQADAFLAADLAPVEAALNALGVPLTQNQFDALASWIFNVGLGREKPTPEGFAGSTVKKRLLARDNVGVVPSLLLWNKPASIVSRREAEALQFAGKAFLARSGEPAPKLPTALLPATATAAAKPAPAPAAAAQAHPPAAKKAPSMFGLITQQWQSILRWGLTSAGTALVAKGIVSASDVSHAQPLIESVVAGLVSLGSLAWSVHSNKAHVIQSTAAKLTTKAA